MKEDQEMSSNERKQQRVASVTVPAATAFPDKETAKRKEEEKRKRKPRRLSRSVSAGQRK